MEYLPSCKDVNELPDEESCTKPPEEPPVKLDNETVQVCEVDTWMATANYIEETDGCSDDEVDSSNRSVDSDVTDEEGENVVQWNLPSVYEDKKGINTSYSDHQDDAMGREKERIYDCLPSLYPVKAEYNTAVVIPGVVCSDPVKPAQCGKPAIRNKSQRKQSAGNLLNVKFCSPTNLIFYDPETPVVERVSVEIFEDLYSSESSGEDFNGPESSEFQNKETSPEIMASDNLIFETVMTYSSTEETVTDNSEQDIISSITEQQEGEKFTPCTITAVSSNFNVEVIDNISINVTTIAPSEISASCIEINDTDLYIVAEDKDTTQNSTNSFLTETNVCSCELMETNKHKKCGEQYSYAESPTEGILSMVERSFDLTSHILSESSKSDKPVLNERPVDSKDASSIDSESHYIPSFGNDSKPCPENIEEFKMLGKSDIILSLPSQTDTLLPNDSSIVIKESVSENMGQKNECHTLASKSYSDAKTTQMDISLKQQIKLDENVVDTSEQFISNLNKSAVCIPVLLSNSSKKAENNDYEEFAGIVEGTYETTIPENDGYLKCRSKCLEVLSCDKEYLKDMNEDDKKKENKFILSSTDATVHAVLSGIDVHGI